MNDTAVIESDEIRRIQKKKKKRFVIYCHW